MPTSLGYHDVAALLAPQQENAHGWSSHLIASPFGTIEPATYTYARPIGTTMPRPPGYQLASFDPDSDDAGAFLLDEPLSAPSPSNIVYPTVNRDGKGDRLPASPQAPAAPAPAQPLPQLQPIDAAPASHPLPPAPAAPIPPKVSRPRHADSPPAAAPMIAANAATDHPIVTEVPAAGVIGADDQQLSPQPIVSADDSGDSNTQVYFDASIAGSPASMERWAPGEEPVMVNSSAESGIKVSALDGTGELGAGESVAGKDDPSRLFTPAQRLGLDGKERIKAEKCLTDAVYFEARGEPYRGQQAVAQVVMNRVFSGYYPHNVCGVVYQNANHYLGCQFTFACEHKNLSRIDEPEMWQQAKQIAKDTLDGKTWLADIGHATHYHAYWVHPSWVHEMKKVDKIGVHTFYRPRAWGVGDDEPTWGPQPDTSKAEAKPQAAFVPAKPVDAKG